MQKITINAVVYAVTTKGTGTVLYIYVSYHRGNDGIIL